MIDSVHILSNSLFTLLKFPMVNNANIIKITKY
jgi:hypothetical protein